MPDVTIFQPLVLTKQGFLFGEGLLAFYANVFRFINLNDNKISDPGGASINKQNSSKAVVKSDVITLPILSDSVVKVADVEYWVVVGSRTA